MSDSTGVSESYSAQSNNDKILQAACPYLRTEKKCSFLNFASSIMFVLSVNLNESYMHAITSSRQYFMHTFIFVCFYLYINDVTRREKFSRCS